MASTKFVRSGSEFEMTLYLDLRRPKEDGYYPLKIKVYTPRPKRRKYYPIGMDMTTEMYEKVFESARPRKEAKELKVKLEQVLYNFIEVANKLDTFTFEAFEKEIFRPEGDSKDIFHQFQKKIDVLDKEGRVGSKIAYQTSLGALQRFMKDKKKRNPSVLYFGDVTPKWLKDFESWMIEKGNTRTSVGIYLRPLRHIFNLVKTDNYPFGKGKYVIPKGSNKKKALDKHQLKVLFEGDVENEYQRKAKDFWFFSYLCKGMNMKDILYLKWKNVKEEHIEFVREKTKDTVEEQVVIRVPLMEHSKKVIKFYGGKRRRSEDYVFQIIHEEMTEIEKLKAKQNFTRLVNQHMKRYAKKIGISENVSTYTARHSFATMAIRNNASIEYVGESLGHADIKTTRAYIKSILDDESDKEMMGKLMEFD
ncbi:site-specific integrase [Echinicola marina]|uniref:tyrosine-type recombinase/integrase n=1 Tax=Echinicola marina TaxID=2859768 RepID=UPI001CF61A6D|nr:site-specific integrase [Echinicola marina]UCS94013.1 site-specific integrase [Echinicola marina]